LQHPIAGVAQHGSPFAGLFIAVPFLQYQYKHNNLNNQITLISSPIGRPLVKGVFPNE
jgi:hypothetical protein